jgi:hypothetical protein
MRKIESLMNTAIANYQDWKLDNTEVVIYDNFTSVYLHDNLIARLGENFVQIFDGGVKSKTTKSRLNAILQENGCDGDSVFQKAHQWFLRVDGSVIPFENGYTFS